MSLELSLVLAFVAIRWGWYQYLRLFFGDVRQCHNCKHRSTKESPYPCCLCSRHPRKDRHEYS